jgi:hypothetical protein
VTELDKFFYGNKPCQLRMKARRFGDQLHLHQQGEDVKATKELTKRNNCGWHKAEARDTVPWQVTSFLRTERIDVNGEKCFKL